MLCNKCRVAPPYQDDTWCLACSAVESLSADLKSRWEFPGLREAAEEGIISAARQVKALRKLSTGLAAERASFRGKVPAAKAEAALSGTRPRSPLPRSASRASGAGGVKKELHEGDDEDSAEGEEAESYSEEDTTLPGATRLPPRLAEAPAREGESDKEGRRSKGSLPPPEPDHPPPGTRRKRKRGGEEGRPKGHRHHRAGTKHKRLSRLVEHPETRVHRSFSHQGSEGHAHRKTW